MPRAKQIFVDGKWVNVQGISEQVDPLTVEKMSGIDVRKDGTLRRSGNGGRPASQFFSAETADRTLTRGNYLAARSSEEYARRERRWYRRLWRYLTHRPPVVDINSAMAGAHARTIDDLFANLKAKAEEKDHG